MDANQDLDSRRGKGCNNASDYSKLALQGGHRGWLHFSFGIFHKLFSYLSKSAI